MRTTLAQYDKYQKDPTCAEAFASLERHADALLEGAKDELRRSFGSADPRSISREIDKCGPPPQPSAPRCRAR